MPPVPPLPLPGGFGAEGAARGVDAAVALVAGDFEVAARGVFVAAGAVEIERLVPGDDGIGAAAGEFFLNGTRHELELPGGTCYVNYAFGPDGIVFCGGGT